MANSVVKVTDIKDDQLSDRLFILVGSDGTVTPDQETVETFLKQKNGPTNIQLMKINKTEKQNIDITVDNVTYMPDVVNEEIVNADVNSIDENKPDMDDIARNLYNFRLDHDYTPLLSPERHINQEDDDLVKTLSILDGPEHRTVATVDLTEPPPLILTSKPKAKPKVNIIQSITIAPPIKHARRAAPPILQPVIPQIPLDEKVESPQDDSEKEEPPSLEPMVPIIATKGELHKAINPVKDISEAGSPIPAEDVKPKAKVIKVLQKLHSKSERVKVEKNKTRIVKEIVEEENDDDYENYQEDFDPEIEDDENDSDYDFEKEIKPKQTPRRANRRSKSETKPAPKTRAKLKSLSKVKSKDRPEEQEASEVKEIENIEKILEKKVAEEVEKPIDKDTETNEDQKPEALETKTPEKKPKKKKEPPKPLLDDFALFSTPDIIRRVGGKDPTTPNTPITAEAFTPVKPARITPESRAKSADQSPSAKQNASSRTSLDQNKIDKEKHSISQTEQKSKERRASSSEMKSRHLGTEEKLKSKSSDSIKKSEKHHSKSESESVASAEQMQNSENIQSTNLNVDTKSYANSSIPIEELNNADPNNINLDATGLDIDPSLLDNLNNDEISEDILYQVAKSLVSNPEIQNAIDKGINDGVLDPLPVEQNVVANQASTQETSVNVIQKGTQIVRPDGRIVVIPPIERPTTRSRGKKKEEEKPVYKPIHKPLDDEHVSGNELDSSNDEEEESEDDPNKLWCICNQPHNNRFMICCDTCEEWYHGKCVNITKTMGQQMEAEGKEWICLFCKDPTLKRPQAAARRVRKASRNSRASTDSTGSSKKPDVSVPCVVCQKPARKSSIYCSEACILAHAQGIERVVVFERSTGKMLMGNKAPSAANLDQWLKEHPGYEVVRSGGKVVTAKAGNLTQSKLKLVKNNDDEGVSLAIQKKGVNVGVLKHAPKHSSHSPSPQPQHSPKQQTPQQLKTPQKTSITAVKIGNKQILLKDIKSKVAQPQVQLLIQTPPIKQKVVQPVQVKTPQSAEKKQKTVPPQVKSPIIKEKLTPKEKTPKTKPKPDTPTTPQPKPQENIRENVQKTILEQLTNRLRGCEDIKLSEEELKNVSTEIEEQLFKCFGDTGQKYRNKYRSLIFNIKDIKNHTLWRRICEKSISPYELVRLSPDDLASQELAKWRENEAKHSLDMIKKSELELLNCNRQYVLKTHKGEQVVEDDRGDKVDNTEVIKSLTEGSTLDGDDGRSDSSKERDKKGSSKHSHKDKERDRERRSTRSYRSSSRERERSRKRSRSRDRKHGDHKKHSRDRDRDRHRKSSHKSSRHKKDIISTTDKLDKRSKEILEQLVDNKIVPPLEDRLWKHVPQEDIVPAIESDSDHEPSSTVTIPTPPRSQDDDNLPISPEKEKDLSVLGERSMSPPPKSKPAEIWRGVINMIDVAQISITAHEVSGDCTGLGKELADNLDIVGRISPDTVWEYIGKMKCSNSKGISLLRLNATNMEEKMPYLALYSYLSSRDRLGVVKSTNKAVKDFYIYPLAPQKPIPQVLLPINGPGFEESRPALLLGIVVRDKRKARTYIEPILPSELYPKKQKVEIPRPATPPVPVVAPTSGPTRSYTPPPLKDPRLKLSLPPPTLTPETPDEGDEPYSPEDSNPEPPVLMEQPPLPLVPPPLPPNLPPILTPAINSSLTESTLPPAAFAGLPGSSSLPSTTLEIQRQMEELNKKIEMQKSEITSMTKTIVSASTEIGTSALANISLPSNLQQILENIKMIGENTESGTPPPKEVSQSDLTIPLMIPKSFSRPLSNPLSVPPPPTIPILPSPSIGKIDLTNDTIPLNLPSKPKIKPHSVNSPLLEEKPIATGSVLGSLSEEDLIRKAAEMLGEDESKPSNKRQENEAVPPTPPKRAKQEISLPPVPGLEDDIIL